MKGWAKGKFQLVSRRWGIEDRQKKKKNTTENLLQEGFREVGTNLAARTLGGGGASSHRVRGQRDKQNYNQGHKQTASISN